MLPHVQFSVDLTLSVTQSVHEGMRVQYHSKKVRVPAARFGRCMLPVRFRCARGMLEACSRFTLGMLGICGSVRCDTFVHGAHVYTHLASTRMRGIARGCFFSRFFMPYTVR